MSTPSGVIEVAPAKVSWLKQVGSVLGKILKIVAKGAAPAADIAARAAEIMFPQFAAEISAADNLIDNIAKEALTIEVMEQAGEAAQGGAAKLQAVVGSAGPAIDQWVASRFPGAAAVSVVKKANLISAVVDIINDVQPPTAWGSVPSK